MLGLGRVALCLRVVVQPLLGEFGDAGYLHQVSKSVAIRLAIPPVVGLGP